MSHAIFAQRIARGPLHSADNMRNEWLLPGDTLYYIGQAPRIYNGEPRLLDTKFANPEPTRRTPISYAVFCSKKKKTRKCHHTTSLSKK